MLFGAHVSAAGGISNAIDRIEEIGGNAVQVFTQSPRMWKPTAHTPRRSSASASAGGRRGSRRCSCHALYLVNLASRDDRYGRTRSRRSRDAGDRARDRRRLGRVPRGLAPRRRLRRRRSGRRAVASRAPRADDRRPLALLENAAGAGGTIGRSIDELAALCDALAGTGGSASASTRATGGPRAWTSPTADALTEALDELDRRVGLERLRACTSTMPPRRSASNRDRHELVGRRADRGRARHLPRPPRVRRPARGSRDLAERLARHRRYRRATQRTGRQAPARDAGAGPRA